MINVDRALRLRLKAVQGIEIDGDSVKRLTNVVERRLGFLGNEVTVFPAIQMEGPVQVHLRHGSDN